MTDALATALTSTRVLSADFTYLEPATRQEALELLHRYQDAGVRILAGGTDLLVKMKTGAVAPRYLLSIKGLADLEYVNSEHGLRFGAGTRLIRLERSAAVQAVYPALYEALSSMAGPAIRHMGTVGGNLCNASPAADTVPALLALDARATLESVRGSRIVPLAELFTGPGQSVLAPDELLTEVALPPVSPDSGSAFVKIGRVSGDIAKVNAAVYLDRHGDTCVRGRVALGAVAPTPIRLPAAEALLRDAPLSLALVDAVADAVAMDIRPITDVRSTAEYRVQVSRVIVAELLQTAWARSGGAALR